MIPLCRADLDERELEALQKVLESGWLTHGPLNSEFEESFAEYLGVGHAVSLNSCTSALFLALKALNITGEVILPSFTFAASANAVVTAGATPVFADIQLDTCNLDPDDVERRINEHTQAIMPVHFAGQPCAMDRLVEVAKRHALHIIEDSAETIGGRFRGKLAGSFAPACFSFFPTKNLTTGEGGMLTTDDPRLAEQIRILAGHGIARSTFAKEKSARPWHRSAVLPGYNMRMSHLQAALGIEQLRKLPEMNAKRQSHARTLNEKLAGIDEIVLPREAPHCEHVYQMYTLQVRGLPRDEFVESLRQKGIGASVHFDPPVHLQDYYCKASDPLPVTEQVAQSIVTLPMFPQLKPEELDTIVTAVKESVRELTPGIHLKAEAS